MAGEHGANWSKHNDQKHHHPSLQSRSQWKDSQAGRGSTALAPASLHSVLHYTGKTIVSHGVKHVLLRHLQTAIWCNHCF